MATASTSLTPVHQPRELTLFCWILDKSDCPFSVDIKDDRTVGHLKRLILNQKPVSFQGVDADELELWKTSLPIDKELKNRVSNELFVDDEMLLVGDPLEEIFQLPEPAIKTLHIVIRHPRPPKRRRPEGQGPYSINPNVESVAWF